MNVFALMAKINDIQNTNPIVKEIVGSVMGSVQQDPKILEDVGRAVSKFAELKGMSVQDLVSSGALTRAIGEFASNGHVTPEEIKSELVAYKCEHCSGVNYHLEKQICSVTTTKSP